MNQNDITKGRQIFEQIASKDRPEWGLRILSAFDAHVGIIPKPIAGLKNIIIDRSRWKEAHDQFGKIRVFALSNAGYNTESYLMLAELVAKITYNASGEPAPFDYDSGYKLPSIALKAAQYFPKTELTEKVKALILTY